MYSIYVQIFTALLIGIFLGDKISAGDACLFLFSLLLSSGLRKTALKKFFSGKVLVVAIAALGILSYRHAIDENCRTLSPLESKYISAVGKVVDLPQSEDGLYTYVVLVKQAEYLGQAYAPGEKVRLTSYEKFNFGDCVRFEGFLKKFPRKLNNGDYDTAKHYKSKGIFFKMHTDKSEFAEENFKIHAPWYFSTWLKSKVSDRIYDNYAGDEAAVLKAIFTGYKDGFSKEFEDMLYKTNTMRLFYPAYLHLSLILSLVGILGTFCKKSIRDKLFIILLIIYSIYNFNTHYIVKTAILAIALTYAKIRVGYTNYTELLCAVCGIMLLLNPLACTESGFVLSVFSGILIYYFVPHVMPLIKPKISKKSKRLIAVWIVLTVGMLPLNAYYFNMTNPYSLLLSFVMIPLIALLWSAVSVNLAILSIFKIKLLTKMTVGLLYFIVKLPDVLCGLPFFTVMLSRPSIVVIIIFYLCLYIIYKKYFRRSKDDFLPKAATATAIGLAISCVTGFISGANDLNINIVNVDQGDGAVISVPFGETVLIDGGGSSEFSDYDYGKTIFVPFLKRNGYTNITAAVVTHYHSDHVKGIIAVMKDLNVQDVIIPDCTEDNKYRTEIEDIAKEKGIKLSYYKTGQILKFSSGMSMKIVAPDDEDLQSVNENDRSYGIRLEYGDFSALFMADITEDAELRHLGQWGDCDMLKVGHHGSNTSTSTEFLAEVKPETAIISVGENNSYSHPHDEVVQRLKDADADIYRTDDAETLPFGLIKTENIKCTDFTGDTLF